MNGLAELFVLRGVVVSGCDLNVTGCENLMGLGVQMHQGHDPAHVDGARAVVTSSAVPADHPELNRARELGLPVIRRAEALAAAVSGGTLIGVAGTHGKTTTTVMTTVALAAAGLDPTGVAGGRVSAWGGNLRRGGDALFVVEADEYDRSFLALDPRIAVVTNMEADHLDIYRDEADIRDAFLAFASRASVLVVCGDDRGAASLPAPGGGRRIVYGLGDAGALRDLTADNIEFHGTGSSFTVCRGGTPLGPVQLAVPGTHNVRNALAAVAAGLELGAHFSDLAGGLAEFRGVERRFEVLGEFSGIAVVDDYAHHPTEIAATIDAARRVYPGRRIVCAFQPHLYTRTRDFAEAFGRALAGADVVLLAHIYAAREKPIPGVDSALVEKALRRAGGAAAWHGPRGELPDALRSTLRAGDVALLLGAGDITQAAHQLSASLESRS
jgi:UDP-N-acetylmuramate--alanine ligase